jgi:uncharacterized protein (UPF0147 family)
MALTGVLGADFSKFTDAVDSAEVKLRSFESGASKVEGALSRMGNSFSGQKVIQDATLMAKVFEDMGGAASFTEKELARMNATAKEAVAKLEAMGQDVPAGIRRVADETKDAAKETETWGGSVKQLALHYLSFQAAMAAGRAALGFVKDAADQAGALADLSAQTRISTDDLQIMAGAMRDFGVDQDQLGKALFKLSKQIAGGDESIAATLEVMGLSLDKVRGMGGAELFETMQDRLAGLQGGLRDTAAIELYGEKLGMVMSGAAEGSKAALAAERERSDFMSKDAIKALDEAGEAWDRLSAKVTAWAATNVLGPIAKGLNEFIEVSSKAGVAATLWARLKDSLVDSLEKDGTAFKDLAASVGIDTAAKKENAGATRDSAAATDQEAGAIARRMEARKKEKEAAAGLKDFQQQTDAAAAKQPYIDAFSERETERINAANEALARRLQAGEGIYNQMLQFARVNKEATDFEKEHFQQQAEVEKQNQELIKSWTTVKETVKDTTTEGTEGFKSINQQIGNTIEMTGDAVKAFMQLQQYTLLANSILNRNSLFTSSSQLEEQARLLGSFTGIVPGRARGGPVSAGQAYVVGEEGPELFLPNVNGAIAPNGSGGAQITNIFHLVDTESNLARRVSDTIMRQVRAGTQLATT